MIDARTTIAALGITILVMMASARAEDYRVMRYGNTSGWSFDAGDDDRDFPSNGAFPGNFATAPSTAWIGAAGLLGSNPQRSRQAYPSQVVFGSAPYQAYCARRHRSFDPATGTYVGKDGQRHRC
jgi:BA14K-like protein